MHVKSLIKKVLKLCLPYGILNLYHQIRETGNYQEDGKGYFSEQGEDILLSQYIKKKQGFYVDIGAYDPDIGSVTKMFYLKGWSGINIDPNPVSIKNFSKKRKRDININIGVSDREAELDFYFLGEESMCNTFDKNLIKENIMRGDKVNILKINVMPINKIFEKYLSQNQGIDFINLDVENYEMTILESFDFKKYGPEYFLIEDLTFINKEIDFMSFTSSPLYQLMKQNGYIVVAKTYYTILFKKDRK
jgi:FkbM family methyltransferase